MFVDVLWIFYFFIALGVLVTCIGYAVWLNILSLIMTMKTIFCCLVDAWTVSKITKLHRTYLRQRVTTRRPYYDKLFQRAMYLSQSSICQTTVVQPVKSLTADSTYKHSFRVNLTGSELSHVKRGIAKYQMKTADALREPSTLHDSDRLHLALRVFRRNWRAATISSLLWQLQAVLDFTAWLRCNWICRLWILSWFLQSRRKILSVCFYLNHRRESFSFEYYLRTRLRFYLKYSLRRKYDYIYLLCAPEFSNIHKTCRTLSQGNWNRWLTRLAPCTAGNCHWTRALIASNVRIAVVA